MSDPRRFDPSIDDDGVIFMMPNALGAYTTYTEWQMVQRQLTEALKPRVCRWRERISTGETERIPSCPQFKKSGISKVYLCPSGEMYCVFCGGKIEVV